MKRRLHYLGVACLSVWGVALMGCHHHPRADDAMRGPECKIDQSSTQLGPGDIFDVRVFEEQQMTGTYRVAPDGTINFPLIGQLSVDGLSGTALGKLVETKLADGYIKSPHVSIFIKEFNSKKISVLGQVTKPGTFSYTEGMTIIEAMTAAGGFTPIASKNNTVVTRSEEGKKRTLQVKVESISEGTERNFCLRPGDIVFVPERIF